MVKIEPADFDTLVAMAMEDPARQAMRRGNLLPAVAPNLNPKITSLRS